MAAKYESCVAQREEEVEKEVDGSGGGEGGEGGRWKGGKVERWGFEEGLGV